MKREMADTPDDVETQEIVRGMERTVRALGVVLSARYFPFKGHYISKINVAHRLAELGRMT